MLMALESASPTLDSHPNKLSFPEIFSLHCTYRDIYITFDVEKHPGQNILLEIFKEVC